MNDRNYAHEIIDQLVDACGPQHPENWGPHDYKINEIANEAQDALEAQQALIDELEKKVFELLEGKLAGTIRDLPQWKRLEAVREAGEKVNEATLNCYCTEQQHNWPEFAEFRQALAACKEGE